MQLNRWVTSFMLMFAAALTAAVSAPLLAQEPGSEPVVKEAAAAKLATPSNMPPCWAGAVLRGVPGQGPSVTLARTSPGCAFPWHWHTASEEDFVVSGPLTFEIKGSSPVVLRAGDYVYVPAHHLHHSVCTGRAPCVVFVSRAGATDYHYVNAAGQEIPLAEALESSAKKGTKSPKH